LRCVRRSPDNSFPRTFRLRNRSPPWPRPPRARWRRTWGALAPRCTARSGAATARSRRRRLARGRPCRMWSAFRTDIERGSRRAPSLSRCHVTHACVCACVCRVCLCVRVC
jgi:hypothetical protein